jgi:hypothetical protein
MAATYDMREVDLSVAGSIASIVSLAFATFSGSTGLVVLGLVLTVVALLAKVRADRHRRAKEIPRAELIAEGNRLIRGASQLVVMFGRDLSWAGDYREAILEGAAKRRTFVICQQSDLPAFRHSAALLEASGARVITTRDDHGIRATLIDSDQRGGGFFFVANKQAAADGEHRYRCKTYDHREDDILITAMHRLFEDLRATGP